MLTVADVKEDVKRVLGGANDAVFFNRLNDAVEILATESEWDPLRGQLDVIVGADGLITLPNSVGTILAVNAGGKPLHGHDFWFKYHLNGPGDDCGGSITGHWSANLPVAVYRNPVSPGGVLVAVSEVAADIGTSFRIYGYDSAGAWIRTVEAGVPVDGVLVPVIGPGASIPAYTTTTVKSISRVEKVVTIGQVYLYVLSATRTLDYRLGAYLPTDKNPTYQQFKVSGCSGGWARIAFRKSVAVLAADTDIIPLHSRYAIILMVKALKKLDEDNLDDAERYQTKAVRLLLQKQLSISIPTGPSIQVADGNLLADKSDRMDW